MLALYYALVISASATPYQSHIKQDHTCNKKVKFTFGMPALHLRKWQEARRMSLHMSTRRARAHYDGDPRDGEEYEDAPLGIHASEEKLQKLSATDLMSNLRHRAWNYTKIGPDVGTTELIEKACDGARAATQLAVTTAKTSRESVA